jgi:hypothetical protein
MALILFAMLLLVACHEGPDVYTHAAGGCHGHGFIEDMSHAEDSTIIHVTCADGTERDLLPDE